MPEVPRRDPWARLISNDHIGLWFVDTMCFYFKEAGSGFSYGIMVGFG